MADDLHERIFHGPDGSGGVLLSGSDGKAEIVDAGNAVVQAL